MSCAKMNSMLKSLGCAAVLAGFSLGVSVAHADYASTVLNNENLIAYYRLSEDPGETTTATDASGNDHHGTYNGSPLTTTGPMADDGAPSLGDDNQAINFNGEGMIAIDPAAVDKEQVTFTGFFRSTGDSIAQRFYTTQASSGYQFTIAVTETNTLSVTVQRRNEGWTAASIDLSSALDGEWHHLVVSRGGNDWSDVAIWIDFESVETTQGSPIGQGLAADAIIGARSLHPANAFHGSMDEVAFFDRAFTQSDVDELKDAR